MRLTKENGGIPAPCAECGHLHYFGHDVYGKCRVCDFDGGNGCPNDPRTS